MEDAKYGGPLCEASLQYKTYSCIEPRLYIDIYITQHLYKLYVDLGTQLCIGVRVLSLAMRFVEKVQPSLDEHCIRL